MDFGLYLHYPFCQRVCPFCDFVTAKKGRPGPAAAARDAAYVEAQLMELERRLPQFELAGFTRIGTLYLGGGTPSLLPVALLERLLKAIRRRLPIRDGAEMTLEVDPQTVDVTTIRQFLDLGINRVSLGIQSFDDATLKLLGRGYPGAAARELIEQMLGCEVPAMSLDLIYGIPGQSVDAFDGDLQIAMEYRPQHISAYQLTISEGSPFHAVMRKARVELPEDDLCRQQLEHAIQFLRKGGYEHYEVSSWARDGHYGQHNLGYWNLTPYIGIGVGAHSYFGHLGVAQRQENLHSVEEYIGRIQRGESVVKETETLTAEQQRFEQFILKMRMRRGMSQQEWEVFFEGANASWQGGLKALLAAGHLLQAGGRVFLSEPAMMISNEIFSTFA